MKIEKVDFNTVGLENEYCGCLFENCDFSKMRISNVYFDACEFKCCNFSLTKFYNMFTDTLFTECKMTGADFSEVNNIGLSFNFTKCHLAYASFIEVKMKKTAFVECDLLETAFDKANLMSSVFDKCDLMRASFSDTNLEKVNFSTARNFSIDPNRNKLRKAIFSESELRGLLTHLDIEILGMGQS